MDKNLRFALIASTIASLFLSAAAFQVATTAKTAAADERNDQLQVQIRMMDELLQEHEKRLNAMTPGQPALAAPERVTP